MVKKARLYSCSILCAGLLLAIWCWVGIAPQPAQAQTPGAGPAPPSAEPAAPADFTLIDSANGVQLYKKDYPNGTPDYVQVIDLSQGARLQLMHGQITEPRPDKGVYGGADPRMTSLPIQTYWSKASGLDPDSFCVTNGLFFYMPEYPTRLAFPLKIDGNIITDGWGVQTYPGQKLLLELWDDRADIAELSSQLLNSTSAPNVIGGLTEEANKRIKYSVGRTFVGVADADDSGSYQTLLVFNSQSSLQSGAADVLRSFGAEKVMMLDGGGSTQLLCKSGWYIRSDRPLPQALAVIAAPPPPIASQLLSHSQWPVIVQGDSVVLELRLQNTGLVSWTKETAAFYLRTGRLEFEQRFTLDGPVAPGAAVTLTQNLTGFDEAGISHTPVEWGIQYQDKEYPGQGFQLDAIVIPATLRERKSELVALVRQWIAEKPNEVGKLAADWVDRQAGYQLQVLGIEGGKRVRPMDAALVPLIMLPIVACLALVVSRLHR
jgi:hypothetical protein